MAKSVMPHAVPEKAPIEKLLSPFQQFAKRSTAGGIVLLLCAVLAMVWANSPFASTYFNFWATPVEVRFGDLINLDKPLILWVNDGLMAIFFFLVGMELKRELLVGELASPKKASLSIVGAMGGGCGACSYLHCFQLGY